VGRVEDKTILGVKTSSGGVADAGSEGAGRVERDGVQEGFRKKGLTRGITFKSSQQLISLGGRSPVVLEKL